MKKTAPIQLEIPKPCSELWAGMTPAAQGHFCASCQKTVIDFSRMSDKEIIDTLANLSGHSCGHFHVSQLGRPLINYKRQEHLLFKRAFLALGLAGSIFCINHLKAASKVNAELECYENAKTDVETNAGPILDTIKVHRIRGYVRDSIYNIPLAGVSVGLRNTNLVWQTDSAGFFELSIPDTIHSDTLFLDIQLASYFSKTINLLKGHIPDSLNIEMQSAKESVYYVDGMIEGVKVKDKPTLPTRVKSTLFKWFFKR